MVLSDCLSKCLRTDESTGSETPSPFFTTGDSWRTSSNNKNWTDGYLPGIHWIAHDVGLLGTNRATERSRTIEPTNDKHSKLGFRYQYSLIPAYEATGQSRFKREALKAAERLSRCYYPELSLLGTPGDESSTVSVSNESLMNVPLLFWAMNYSPNGEDYKSYLEDYLRKATRLFVKPNGAVRHRIEYNTETMDIDRVNSPRGVPGGCWARGLAWTVYGLTVGGIYLSNEEFIDTAKTAVDYHLENTYDLIPAFDYSVSTLNKPNLTDTSAAAILASAMMILGRLRDNSRAETLGTRITDRLFEKYRREPDQAGLIDGGCFHYPEDRGVNEATIWGDFHALEARYMIEHQELPTHLNWLQTTPHTRRKAS